MYGLKVVLLILEGSYVDVPDSLENDVRFSFIRNLLRRLALQCVNFQIRRQCKKYSVSSMSPFFLQGSLDDILDSLGDRFFVFTSWILNMGY
jgi:hypothetical protein